MVDTWKILQENMEQESLLDKVLEFQLAEDQIIFLAASGKDELVCTQPRKKLYVILQMENSTVFEA